MDTRLLLSETAHLAGLQLLSKLTHREIHREKLYWANSLQKSYISLSICRERRLRQLQFHDFVSIVCDEILSFLSSLISILRDPIMTINVCRWGLDKAEWWQVIRRKMMRFVLSPYLKACSLVWRPVPSFQGLSLMIWFWPLVWRPVSSFEGLSPCFKDCPLVSRPVFNDLVLSPRLKTCPLVRRPVPSVKDLSPRLKTCSLGWRPVPSVQGLSLMIWICPLVWRPVPSFEDLLPCLETCSLQELTKQKKTTSS
jgi:hypothetical protein